MLLISRSKYPSWASSKFRNRADRAPILYTKLLGWEVSGEARGKLGGARWKFGSCFELEESIKLMPSAAVVKKQSKLDSVREAVEAGIG